MKLLTYNISYQAMSGKAEGSVNVACPTLAHAPSTAPTFLSHEKKRGSTLLPTGNKYGSDVKFTGLGPTLLPIDNKYGSDVKFTGLGPTLLPIDNKYGSDVKFTGLGPLIDERKTICLKRIAQVIDTQNDLDFVSIIEAIRLKELISESVNLKKFGENVITAESHRDRVSLFYNNKYILDKYFTTEFDKGRPIVLAFFNNYSICVIAVHGDHQMGIFNIGSIVKNSVGSDDKCLECLNNKLLILMGDFNYAFSDKETHFNFIIGDTTRKLYGITRDKTCCINDLGMNENKIKFWKNYDHILASTSDITSQALTYITLSNNSDKYPKYTSDHLPVISYVKTEQYGGIYNEKYIRIKYFFDLL